MKNTPNYVAVENLDNGNANIRINERAAFDAGDASTPGMHPNPVYLHVELIDGAWMVDDDDCSQFSSRDEAIAHAVNLTISENS